MELKQLQDDMIVAMKARDKVRKDAISSIIAAVKKVAIDEGCRENIPSEMVDKVILKELKTIKEQIDTCPSERADLKEEYHNCYQVISEYAPVLMDAKQVKEYLEKEFSSILETKNKGQIMKAVMGSLKGKADGKVINEVVATFCE